MVESLPVAGHHAPVPSDYRSWRSEAAERDRAYAEGWQAGVENPHHEHRALMVAGIVGALLVFGRRLHPVRRLLVALVLVAVLSPFLALVTGAELTVRQHRRHHSWRRTLAYLVSWLAGAGFVLLALAYVSVWPLVGVVVLVVAWCAVPRVIARRGHGRGPGHGGDVDPSRPAPLVPFVESDATLPESLPYRRTFTSCALHVETRHCADGRSETVDTLTGEIVPDSISDVHVARGTEHGQS